MGLISTIGPYLALLSFLVSCIPGVYWLFKRMSRSTRHENSILNQHKDDGTLPTSYQHPSSAILLGEYHQPSTHSLLLRVVNCGNGQVPITSQRLLASYQPLQGIENQVSLLGTTRLGQAVQEPVELPAEQYWYLNSMWHGRPHERTFSQGVNHYHP